MNSDNYWQKIDFSSLYSVFDKEEIEFFHDGYENEINEFEKILFNFKTSNQSITRFLKTDYDVGKIFLLKVIEEMAFKNNYVVSRINFGDDYDFCRNNFYVTIISNLTCNAGNSLKDIINKWICDLRDDAIHKFPENVDKQNIYIENEIKETLTELNDYNNSFSVLIKNYFKLSINDLKSDIADMALSWICGENNIPYSIKKEFGVKGDIDKNNALYFLEALSIFIKSIGYSGFVVLFDECELMMDFVRKDLIFKVYPYINEIFNNSFFNQYKSSLFVFAGKTQWFDDSSKGIGSDVSLSSRMTYSKNLMGNMCIKPLFELNNLENDDLNE